MLHSQVLQLLLPVPWIMTANELVVYGAALDAAKARLDAVLAEMAPDTAQQLLAEWESLYRINPFPGATVGERQQAAAAAYRATGDIKKPYYMALALAHGYTIRIEDFTTSMAGWCCSGDEILQELWQYFEAGCAMSGDYLAQEYPVLNWIWNVIVVTGAEPWPYLALEQLLNDLKPEHIQLNFTYVSEV